MVPPHCPRPIQPCCHPTALGRLSKRIHELTAWQNGCWRFKVWFRQPLPQGASPASPQPVTRRRLRSWSGRHPRPRQCAQPLPWDYDRLLSHEPCMFLCRDFDHFFVVVVEMVHPCYTNRTAQKCTNRKQCITADITPRNSQQLHLGNVSPDVSLSTGAARTGGRGGGHTDAVASSGLRGHVLWFQHTEVLRLSAPPTRRSQLEATFCPGYVFLTHRDV